MSTQTNEPAKTATGFQIKKLAAAVGCVTINCRTCESYSADYDGDHGEIYCGSTCNQRSGQGFETYLEDQGIDIDAAHGCWVPEFWHTKFANLQSGNDNELAAAVSAFKSAVTPFLLNA